LIVDVHNLAPGLPRVGRVEIALSDGTTFTDLAMITEIWGDPAVSPRGMVEMRGALGRTVDVAGERYRVPELGWPDDLLYPFDADVLADRSIGSLVAGALGDGLGGPVERMSREAVRAMYGPRGVTDLPPAGALWSDDTQLTAVVARSLIASDGQFESTDFVPRLVAWLPTGRGVGRATEAAVTALGAGEPWDSVGPRLDSSGNGAAMRTAPVGLVHALDDTPTALFADAVRYALPTHGGAVGVAGAIAIAAGVGYLARRAGARETSFSAGGFADFIADATGSIEPAPTPTRRPPGTALFLSDRLRAIPGWLRREPVDVFEETWTGAFALESVPAAIYAFLRSPDDPKQVLLTAANASHDTDTIAAMAGNLMGAWLGATRIAGAVPDWWAQVQRRDELESLGRELTDIAARRAHIRPPGRP
jgi:ADP-ribosylglycohydrolase